MKFSVTILGSSSALPTSKRFPTAHLLNVNERFYLIDCGEGTQIQLRRFKQPFNKVKHIFISHLHGDHIFGIFGLISSLELLGKKDELHIYAHKEFEKILAFYQKFYDRKISFRIIHHIIDDKQIIVIHEDKKIRVTSFPLIHKIPVSGFVFKEHQRERNIKKEAVEKYQISIKKIHEIKGGSDYISENGVVIPNKEITLPPYKSRSYAFITDTISRESVIPVIKNADLLYHEATFRHEELNLARNTCHSTSVQAAEIAKKSKTKKLLIGHFSARYKDINPILKEAKTVFPETIAVNDGDIYTVPLEREAE